VRHLIEQPPTEFAVDPPATHKANRFAQRISADIEGSVVFMWLVKFDCIVIICIHTMFFPHHTLLLGLFWYGSATATNAWEPGFTVRTAKSSARAVLEHQQTAGDQTLTPRTAVHSTFESRGSNMTVNCKQLTINHYGSRRLAPAVQLQDKACTETVAAVVQLGRSSSGPELAQAQGS
jgi:hypothetical protein